MQLGYLYSRYPVLSQTFCDMEMLELERRGCELVIGAVHPPLTSSAARTFPPFSRAGLLCSAGAGDGALGKEHSRRGALAEGTGGTSTSGNTGRNSRRRSGPEMPLISPSSLPARPSAHFHVHFANRAAHTALFVKEISGIPFSVTAHGQDFMSDLGQDDLLREICNAAEFVAVETDYSRGLLQARCPEAAEKIHRVYNGLDLANLPAPAEEGRPPGPTTILSVGRLVAFKGFEVLLEACAELARRDFDFRCQIVGDGPLREKLEHMVADLKLGPRVELCGSLSQGDVYARLRECDIFALACVVDAEGASDVFPTVIMEAMTCAKPVVSTTLAGIPESVVDGATGLLVPPGNAAALAAALETLVRDPELRTRLGRAGRERMTSEFNVAKTVEPLCALFADCLARSPVPHPAAAPVAKGKQTAYLIDRWPDPDLPFLEMELRALQRNHVPHVAFVMHPPVASELGRRRQTTSSSVRVSA